MLVNNKFIYWRSDFFFQAAFWGYNLVLLIRKKAKNLNLKIFYLDIDFFLFNHRTMTLKILPISFVLILSIITLFGFLGVSFINHQGGHLCPFAANSGGKCPNNVFALVLHHIAGLKSISQAVVGFDLDLAVYSFLLLFFVSIFASLLKGFYPPERARFRSEYLCPLTERLFLALEQILFWLSLHNKRDSELLSQRVCDTSWLT